MYEINRSVFRLVPLQPFWNWLTALPGAELGDLTLEDLQNNANAYLTNPCDDGGEVWAEIKSQIDTIFAEWFDIQLSPILCDLSAREVEREPFQPL